MKAKLFFFLMLGLVSLTLVGSSGLYYFMNSRLNAKIGQLSQTKEDIAVTTEEIANLESLNKRLKEIENIKPMIEAALPRGKTQSESVAQILSIARLNGVNFRTITFEATQGLPAENSQTKTSKVVPSVSTVPITLETESVRYETLKDFLRDVFAIRRNANVSSLMIIRDADNPGRVSARLTIDIHLEKVAEVLTEAEKEQRRKEAEKAASEES
jgi:Tfp pilus assembly protein PilO